MKRRMLRALPLGLASLVWAAGAVLLIVNLLLPALGHGRMKLAPGLVGVVNPEKAVFSWSGVLNGTFQAAYGHLIGTEMPLYPSAVRFRNELQYKLFGDPGTAQLLLSSGPKLVEAAYADEYCARNLITERPVLEEWAGQIREIQDFEERRGKVFMYELTPSKVSQYPDVIPAGYTCPATAADRDGLIPAWLAMLRAHGVHVADTTAVMTAARGAYPFRMYPQGGAHWNAVGSALSMQLVMAELNRLAPGGGFVPFTFDWHMVRRAFGLDVDLARLTNLMWRFPASPVPVVDLHPGPAPEPCPNTRIAIVGGSFSHALLETLVKTTCNPPAVEYEYWRRFKIYYLETGAAELTSIDEAERARSLLSADVLIYEENEQVMPRPMQGDALWKFIHAQPAASP